MDFLMLIIALSISTYVVSSIYYRRKNKDILPNLITLCYLWQIIGVGTGYLFFYEELYRILNRPSWLVGVFTGLFVISALSFTTFLAKRGFAKDLVLKTVFLSSGVTAVLFSVAKGYMPINCAMYLNITIYAVCVGIMYAHRDLRQSSLYLAQISVAIIVLTLTVACHDLFPQLYSVGISNGAIFLIALGCMLYYLEFMTLTLKDANQDLIKEKEISDILRWKYDQALSVTNEGIWEYDLSSNKYFVSGFIQEHLKCDTAYPVNLYESLLKHVHPCDYDRLVDHVGGGTEADLRLYCDAIGSAIKYEEIRIYNEVNDCYVWYKLKIRSAVDPLTGAVKLHGTISDIQDIKNAEEKTYHLAYYDQLTGLRNQVSFSEYVKNVSQPYTLFLIDLDRFKYVNDSRGSTFGDKVLQSVGMRLFSLWPWSTIKLSS